MPEATVTHRLVSETVGISVEGSRYRATRSQRRQAMDAGVFPPTMVTPWTLWHDCEDGGSHSVAHADEYHYLADVLRTAIEHQGACSH